MAAHPLYRPLHVQVIGAVLFQNVRDFADADAVLACNVHNGVFVASYLVC